MGKYIKYYDTHSEYNEEKNLLDLPNVAWCEQEEDVHYGPEIDYSKEYLTFIIVEDGTLIWKTEGSLSSYLCNINYSIDNGTTWTQISPSSTPFLNVNEGQKILFKGTNSQYTYFYHSSAFCKNIFGGTALFNVSGNIMSMIGGDNFINTTNINYESLQYRVFDSFFMNCNVVNAKDLILPINVVYNCYSSMFKNCSNLISAPKLPATTLAGYCYDNMFFGCTSLTTAPELLAETLGDTYCYNEMFKGCSNLNYIKAMFITTPNSNYTYNWVNGVSSTGTFIKNSSATWTTTGNNGVPTGWTVQTASS